MMYKSWHSIEKESNESSKRINILKIWSCFILLCICIGLLWVSSQYWYLILFLVSIVISVRARLWGKHLYLLYFMMGWIFLISNAFSDAIFFIKSIDSNNPLVAIQTVWNPDEMNIYHNDTIIYTIIKNKDVIIPRDCVYQRYLEALGSNIEYYETIPNMVSHAEMEKEDFQFLGYSNAMSFQTLFDKSVTDEYAENRKKDELHGSGVYLESQSIELCDTVLIQSDEHGCIYVKGIK